MKRDPALHTLSFDHQNALARALRLRRVRDADSSERRAERKSFVKFADERLSPHFVEEEKLINRAIKLAPESTVLSSHRSRIIDEHEQIRAAIESLRDPKDEPSGDHLYEIGSMLTKHIRFEERELFEMLQQEFGDQITELVDEQ